MLMTEAGCGQCLNEYLVHRRTSPGDIADTCHLFKHKTAREGSWGTVHQSTESRGPSAVLCEDITSSQEDAFLGPPGPHTPISKDWAQPSSNDSDDPTQQTQCDHSSLRAGETPFPLLQKETLSEAKPAGEGSAS